MATVVSVNVGLPRPVEFETTSLPMTGIEKRPVEGPVRITSYGVEGNACGDTAHHGDEFMRVYAYASEDYRWWEAELGRPPGRGLPPGHFAEQVTTEGIDLNAALVGETWRVGTAVLQISHVRIPCRTFKGWMGHTGHDDTSWVRRFARAGRPGPYFRVLEEGAVAAGDPIVVLDRPDHDVTVATLFRALLTEPALLPRLLVVDGLKDWVRERARAAADSAETSRHPGPVAHLIARDLGYGPITPEYR
ncbi:MAG TPA: MOSC domain-containing protein [Marmoricola sp.]|nr:MOSC domain-containing protein [Marmoricola sp.]